MFKQCLQRFVRKKSAAIQKLVTPVIAV